MLSIGKLSKSKSRNVAQTIMEMMILTLQRLTVSFDSKGYGVKNPMFYVLYLVCFNLTFVYHSTKGL